MLIRPAHPGDLEKIAACQIASWQNAYRGMVPDNYLECDVPKLLTNHWANWPGPSWRIDTAWRGDTLLGFIALDLDHSGGAYVNNLHVAQDGRRQGIGARLMQVGAQHALPQQSLWLTVLKDNAPARAFYRRLGGTEQAATPQQMVGHIVMAVPIRWQTAALASLAAR